jgi:hypothetical protein
MVLREKITFPSFFSAIQYFPLYKKFFLRMVHSSRLYDSIAYCGTMPGHAGSTIMLKDEN